MLRQTERFVRAERSDLQRLNWQFQVVNRAGRRRKVPYIIHRAIKKNKLGHILLDEPKVPLASQVRDVVHAASDQIVNGNDFVAPLQQQVHQMRAEKPRAASHHRRGLMVLGFAFLRVAHIKRQDPSRFLTRLLGSCPWGPLHLAPVPSKTTGIVRQRIFKSSHNDQLSIYSKSSRTQSVKSCTSLRPLTCQRQVSPGLTLRRRRCARSSNRLTSSTGRGRGPTRLISPRTTFTN